MSGAFVITVHEQRRVNRQKRRDLRSTQKFIIDRIYHEDTIFAQRIYNFLVIHAILAAIFSALALKATDSQSHFEFEPYALAIIIAITGIVLALAQVWLSKRTMAAIQVWRQYERGIESKLGIPLDSILHRVFKNGTSNSLVGNIEVVKGGEKVFDVFPWREIKCKRFNCVFNFMGSANDLLAKFLPFLIIMMWFFGVGIVLFSKVTMGFWIFYFIVFVLICWDVWIRGPGEINWVEGGNEKPTSNP